MFAFLFGVTLAGQVWANTILRQDDNQTTDCYFYSNYFQFDFNNGASFEISFNGEIIETSECIPVEEYSATHGACVRNFVINGTTIEFDLLDGEYSTTEFAHYITNFPVAVSANAVNGTVSIEGSNAVGQTIVLTVTPNDDYEFNCWSDGNTDNPRTIVINGNMDLKAFCLTEGQTLVNLTVTGGENGTVSGGGVYVSGTVARMHATPNSDYHFVRWSDSNTDNPRTVTVTSDATFAAEFEEHTVVIDAADPPTSLPGFGYTEGSHCSVCGKILTGRNLTYWCQITASAENGSVNGAGLYVYGQTVTLTVTPDDDYEFNCWSDGNTDNPRTITIGWGSENLDFKALCMTEGQSVIIITAAADENGSAIGGGIGISGIETTVTLQATPNRGYHFTHWSDGNADNPRTVTVTSNATFTAEFEAHTLIGDGNTVPATDTESGWTESSHCSVCGAVIPQRIILPHKLEIYRYETNGNNSDVLVEPDNGVYALNTYETDVNNWDSQFFIVFADQNISVGNDCDVKFEYRKLEGSGVVKFDAQGHSDPHGYVNNDGWSMLEATEEWQEYTGSFEITGEIRTLAVNASIACDNGTLLLRNIVIKVNGYEVVKTKETMADTEVSSVSTASNNDSYGTTEVIGEITYGSEVSLKATPAAHYHFVSWNDNNTDNPRTVTVTGNATYTANFAINSYNVVATSDATAGNAYSSHSKVDYGTAVSFYAIPKYGYYFKNWSNGSTAAMQNITISQDTTLTAIFEKYPSVIVKDTIIHDTIKVEVPVTVTNTVVEYIKDTIVETVKDTIIETIKDTIIQTVKDTIVQTVKDTITVTDTIRITNTDTIKIQTIIYDTITNTVHDTIYITKTDTVYLQTSVSEKNAIGLKVYPNPTVSFVTVDADAEFSFVLTDLNGKLLRKEENAASYLLDLSEYPDGVYLLNTSDGTTHKIVKE